ncbi:MAG: DegQ family serine endoprotease [Nitrospiraceae bacterium]
MNRTFYSRVVTGAAAVGLGVMLLWGGIWFADSHAAPTVSHQTPATAETTATAVDSGTALPAAGFAPIAKSVTPAVVNITASSRGERTSAQKDPRQEWKDRREEFGWPFGGPNGPRMPHNPFDRGPHGDGMGSGVIVSPDGYILTNNHVVEGARELTVTLPDKREFKATVIGTDPKSDLAVIKIDGKNLLTVSWGDSSKLQVGDYVLAVGNPFGLNSTVTLGIVSAVGRGKMGITQYEDFIQTDAAINPGNSGGALVNTKGELVGVNTAIFSQTGGYQGVGFAVSTAMAKPIYESLVKTGKVVRGYLGVSIQDINQDLAKSFGLTDQKGALVGEVKEDSPADKAGLKQGDVVIGYQNQPIEDSASLQRLVTRAAVGDKATIRVWRDGRERTLTVTIGEQSDEVKTARADSESGEAGLAGLAVQELDRDAIRELGLKAGTKGVVVADVEPDSPAERAGIARGDVIREINRQPVQSVKDFERLASGLKKEESALFLINRRGASLFLSVKI